MSIVAGQLSDARLQLFADHGGVIWSTWQTNPDPGAGWLPWSIMEDTQGLQPIATASLPNGALALFAVDNDNGGAMYSQKLSSDVNAPWSGFESVFESSYVLSIAAVSPGDGQTQAFVWANDPQIVYQSPGQLYTNFKSGSDVSNAFSPAKFFDPSANWGRIPEPNSPASGLLLAAPLPDNGIQLWLNGPSPGVPFQTIWRNGDANSEWVPWGQFEGVPDTSNAWQLAVGQLPDGRLQLWAFSNTASTLYSCWKGTTDANSPWTPWLPFLSTLTPGVLSLAVAPLSDGGSLQVWARVGDNAIWSTRKLTTEPSANWAPWSSFVALP